MTGSIAASGRPDASGPLVANAGVQKKVFPIKDLIDRQRSVIEWFHAGNEVMRALRYRFPRLTAHLLHR
jgi:hypothetical protein